MKVSVIVANRNGEKNLFRCVSSLVEQTLEDMEILLVDASSVDGSRALMEDYRSQFPELIRCVYLDGQTHLGEARNRGIQEAKGEYIAFVDSSDFVEPDMCEELYYAAKGADMCGADYWTEYRGIQKEVYLNFGEGTELNEEKRATFLNGCGSFATRIYRKEFLDAHQLRFLEGIFYEDSYFVFMTALYAKDVAKAQGRYYHLTGEGIEPDRNERYQRLEIPGKILADCKERGIYQQHKDLIDYKYIAMQTGNICNICLQKPIASGKAQLGRIAQEMKEVAPDFAECPYYKQIPWSLRAYLRLTLISPEAAVVGLRFGWAINLCAAVHDLFVK